MIQKNGAFGVLSVVIPCYNEASTIETILGRVFAQDIVGEVIVVNDASTDDSLRVLESISNKRLRVSSLAKNQGKGNAIATGIKLASLPFLIIQDADLEYHPMH